MDYLQKIASPTSPSSFSSSSSSSSSSSPFDACPFSIDSELWHVAEKRIQEILWVIHPVLASEHKRKEIIDYIRMLIKAYHTTEVLPFGSVPLKTYLPDGDIDLTALSQPNKEEELAREVCNILECEEKDPRSEVKNVRYIEAQVKVVKCCVKDISIDISFNQIPGLSTLCFLEKVDQLIGKNHLLKHSILLIKAWCFYESRILGAYHGLISTYALEILVLHIINIFHSSLQSPLAVLYKFLEYYSTFDWHNYCISINGPVAISSLRGIAAESLEDTTSELLLNPEFLRSYREKVSVPVNGTHEFPIKHLNILDPLKYDNNLGRSVSKGSFNRIKCALTFGAQRLREIFKHPGHTIGARLEEFFKNTLDRNGKGERPDTPVLVPAFGTGKSQIIDLSGDYDNHYNSLLQSQWYINAFSPPLSPQMSPPVAPSEFQLRDNGHRVSMFVQNTHPQMSTTVYVPNLPPGYPCVSQQYAGASVVDQLGKSRGTGTYIPNVHSGTYRNLLSCMRQRSPGSRCHSPLNSPRKSREAEPGEIENRGNGCHDLSPDQFPPLPSCKNLKLNPTPSEKSMEVEPKEIGNTENCHLDLSLVHSSLLSCHMNPTPQSWEGEPKEIEKRENSNLDLSLDQFPLLPSCKHRTASEKSMGAEPEEREKREKGCHDLSLDEFPLLPSRKNQTPPENNQPVFKSLQAKERSSLRCIKFGTYKHMSSPLSQSSSLALTEEESKILVTLETGLKMELLNNE